MKGEFRPKRRVQHQMSTMPQKLLAYSDFSRCRIERHSVMPHRRNEVPDFMLDIERLREVLTRFTENRAQVAPLPGILTQRERRARALRRLAELRTAKVKRLDRLCRAYIRAPKSRQRQLAKKIEALDTALITDVRIVELAALTAYLYHRLNLNSVDIALQLGCKPPHVRQVLYRLKKVAAKL